MDLKYGFNEPGDIVEKLIESYKNDEEDYIMENKIEDIHKEVKVTKVARKKTVTREEMEVMFSEMENKLREDIKLDVKAEMDFIEYRLFKGIRNMKQQDMEMIMERFTDLQTLGESKY